MGPGRGLVREQGTNRVLVKPSRGELRDKSNTTCQGCRVTFGERQPFLQHCRSAHKWRIKAKRGLSPPPSQSPRPARPSIPPLKGSPGKRGLSLPLAPGPDAIDGRLGPRPTAHAQLGGRPNLQGRKLGAFQSPGPEDHTARKQPRYQTEEARKAGAASHRMSSGDDPLANRREEEEIQDSDHADGEAGRTNPVALV